MNPVVFFDGIEANHINADRLSRTVRLVPEGWRSTSSYADVINGLTAIGVEAEDVEGIFKVSAYDSAYSVMLSYSDTVEKVMQHDVISIGNKPFHVMKMTEQIVSIRAHWLPLYFDNSILNEILSQYGEIIDIKMLKTAHAEIVTYDGVREIKMKVNELQKQQIPHLVKFPSGQSVLLTMAGRPPYCLKCSSIGHTRQRCPGRTYASTTAQPVVTDNNVTDSVLTPSPPPAVPAAPPAAPPAGPSGQAGGSALMESVEGGAAGGDASGSETQERMFEESDSSLKRSREAGADPDFITPNRTAKYRPVSSGPPIALSNSFTPVMTVEDLMKDS